MNKKKQYLRIVDKKKKKSSKKQKGVFWKYLDEGRLPYSRTQFTILSLISAVVFFIVYYSLSKLVIFSLTMSFVGLCAPYFFTGMPSVLSSKFKEALEYKEFLSVLQSGLRASNSTSEAIKIVAESDDLSKPIKKIIGEASRDLGMGESLPSVLEAAKEKTDNNHFKMALSIIKINHLIGSDETTGALKNIQKSMNTTIDNIQLFKDKVNGIITVKSFFLGLSLVVPFFLFSQLKEVTEMFWKLPYADLILALIMGFVLLGQFIMDSSAYKLIKEV